MYPHIWQLNSFKDSQKPLAIYSIYASHIEHVFISLFLKTLSLFAHGTHGKCHECKQTACL